MAAEGRDSEFWSTREAADLLGVSLRTVQLWTEAGVLKAWKTAGGHRRINRDSVMQLLRGACRFAGPALSDDLEMKAVSAHFPLEEVVPGAVSAGVDGLLACHRADVQNRAVDLLRQAVERGTVSRERLAEARARIARLLSWASPPGNPVLAGTRLRLPAALALAARLPSLAGGEDPTAA